MNLEDIRVLDVSTRLPGPFATQLLADLGADVVSVEPPGGDPTRDLSSVADVDGVFATVNQGKRSVVLDLKTPAGQEALGSLAAETDVVVEGFPPETAKRLGVDEEAIRERNGDVVHCSLTGFGQTGPHRHRPAHGLTVTGMSGFLDQNRHEQGAPPAIPGFSVADQTLGFVATLCILGGLLSRELGGDGCHIDAAMLEALLALSGNAAPVTLAGGDPAPGNGAFSGRYPWYDVYECTDGGYVTLAALERSLWESFCEAVDRPELVDEHGATDPVVLEALRSELATLFRKRPRDEWIESLPDDSIVGPVCSVGEALDSDHLRERGLVQRGDAPRVGFPALIDGARPGAGGHVPATGEHTADVLRDVGADETLISRVVGEDG